MKLSQIRKEIQNHVNFLEKSISKHQKEFDDVARSGDEKKGVDEKAYAKMQLIAASSAFPRAEQEIWGELLSKINKINPISEYKETLNDMTFFQANPLQKAFNEAFEKSCKLLLKYPAFIVRTKVLTGPQSAQVVDLTAGMTLDKFVATGKGYESHTKLFELKEIVRQGKCIIDAKPIHVELTDFSTKVKLP